MSGYVETSREPLRPVVADETSLEECLIALRNGSGPVAFDAERAHGHRYWPKAYLFQIRREGAGTWLIDPLPFESSPRILGGLVDACGDALWLIHAATQDLPCMREVGIYPARIFDTELAARLMSQPASLRALLEEKLGIRLRKAHSADNWATRPLPEAWLTYAALDVDYLIDLYGIIHDELVATGRLDWAEQEFQQILASFAEPTPPAPEPWRRLSGLTTLRHPRQLAVARALWEERETIARNTDRPPGRLLPDSAIVAYANLVPASGPVPDTRRIENYQGFTMRSARRYRVNWQRAIRAAADLPESSFPARRLRSTGVGHPRSWERRNPQAAEAWQLVKPAIDDLACDLGLQASLLAPPAAVQDVIYHHWQATSFETQLREAGLRPWQIDFLAPLLAEQLTAGDGLQDTP